MDNRYDGLLRTDAWQHPVYEAKVGRYHVPAASALVADTNAILAATKRVKTTAWVASTARLTNSTDDTLDITAPMMMGATPNGEVKFKLATSLTDAMSVAVGTGETADTVTITVAKTTAANNTAALIQAAIRALATVNGIDVSGFTCAGSATWDAQTVAKKDDNAVAMASGVTGGIDVITTGISNPPQPRNITAKSAGTAGDIGAVAVTVYGTDFNDEPIQETLPYFTANSGTTVVGVKAFKTINRIDLPAHDGADATSEIGFGSLFGLPYMLNNKMIQVAFDGVFETTAPTIVIDSDEVCKNTIQIAGTLDGAKDVDILIYL